MIKNLVLLFIFCIFAVAQAIGQATNPAFYDLDFITTDEELLSSLIHSECGICGQEEQIYVGATVLTRMRKRNMTLREVIFEPFQYAGTETNNFYPTKQGNKIAKHLLDPTSVIPDVEFFVGKHIRDIYFVKDLEIKLEGKYHYYF